MIDVKMAVLAMATGGASLFSLGTLRGNTHCGLFLRHRDPAMVAKFIDFAMNERLDQVGATDAQKQKIREVKNRLFNDGRELYEGRAALRLKILALLAQDNPDPAELRALIRERTAAVSRLGDEAADALLEIHGTLTPEQRQKLLAAARAHLEERWH